MVGYIDMIDWIQRKCRGNIIVMVIRGFIKRGYPKLSSSKICHHLSGKPMMK